MASLRLPQNLTTMKVVEVSVIATVRSGPRSNEDQIFVDFVDPAGRPRYASLCLNTEEMDNLVSAFQAIRAPRLGD